MPDSEGVTREEIDKRKGKLLLEFGASWCPHCQALAPTLAQLLAHFPQIAHLKIEDGKGKRLGRTFKVKLWPNLVFLKDGEVMAQLARPSVPEVEAALRSLAES